MKSNFAVLLSFKKIFSLQTHKCIGALLQVCFTKVIGYYGNMVLPVGNLTSTIIKNRLINGGQMLQKILPGVKLVCLKVCADMFVLDRPITEHLYFDNA